MLRAAVFLEKSLEADMAAYSAPSDAERAYHAALARTWRRMAEFVFKDNVPQPAAA